jgi:hypothetical protein
MEEKVKVSELSEKEAVAWVCLYYLILIVNKLSIVC